jgi:phage-related protein
MDFPYLDALANVEATVRHRPKLLKYQFGDGYLQIQKNGINNDLASVSVQFVYTRTEEMDVLYNFLKARGGEPFYFVLIPEDRPLFQSPQNTYGPLPPLYYCEEYDRVYSAKHKHILQAKFEEFVA